MILVFVAAVLCIGMRAVHYTARNKEEGKQRGSCGRRNEADLIASTIVMPLWRRDVCPVSLQISPRIPSFFFLPAAVTSPGGTGLSFQCSTKVAKVGTTAKLTL